MKIDQSTTNGCLQHWSAAENRSGFLAKNQLHLWFITQFSTLLTWFRIRISFETVSHKVRICWIVNLRLVAGVVDRTLPERTFGRLDRPLLLATLQTQSCTGTSAVLSKPCCFSLSEYDSSGRTGRKEELPCCTNWSRNYVIIAYDILKYSFSIIRNFPVFFQKWILSFTSVDSKMNFSSLSLGNPVPAH